MSKYSNISETAQAKLKEVRGLLQPIQEAYRKQIEDLTPEETSLLVLEYLDQLRADLAITTMQEDLKRRKQLK